MGIKRYFSQKNREKFVISPTFRLYKKPQQNLDVLQKFRFFFRSGGKRAVRSPLPF